MNEERAAIASENFKTLNFKLLVAPLFICAGVAAYANVADTFFLSDDFAQIGRVLGGDLSVTWGQSHGGFFRPLFILSYLFDASLWGGSPLAFHLTNIILHASNSLLVLRLARQLLPSSADSAERSASEAEQAGVALSAALIFLLHPSHTEAVTWISGRADLLAALFGLLALSLYVSLAQTRETGRAVWLCVLLLVCFALALLAKEAAICLPLVMLSCSTRDGERRRRALLPVLLCFLLLACYLLVRRAALGALIGGYGASQHLNFTHGVLLSQLLRSFLRALFPALALRSMTFLESRLLSPILILTGVVVVLLLAVYLSRAQRRTRLMERVRRNALLWRLALAFVCALLPAINLRINVFDTQGERYLYFPSVFSSIALALILHKLVRGRVWRAVFLAGLLIFYAVSLWQTNRIWREAARISRRVAEETVRLSTGREALVLNLPDNLRGVHLYRNGFEQAVSTFQNAKRLTRVHVVAFHPIESAADASELKQTGAELALQLSNAGTTFERVMEATPCVETTEHAGGLLRVRVQDCAADFDIFYFSRGRMLKFGGDD